MKIGRITVIIFLLIKTQYIFSQVEYDALERNGLLEQKAILEKVVSNSPIFKSATIISNSSNLLRSNPTILSKILRTVYQGDSITAIGYENEFVKVKVYGNQIGYINSIHLENYPEISLQIAEFNNIELSVKNLEKVKYLLKLSNEELRQKLLKENEALEKERDEIDALLRTDSIIKKYQKLGSPLAFSKCYVSFNSIGVPEVNVERINITADIIDAYTVDVSCYDNFNRPVKHYLYSNNIFNGISQVEILSMEKGESSWELHGYDNTTKIKVFLKKVHFTNGKTWIPKSNPIQIKSY